MRINPSGDSNNLGLVCCNSNAPCTDRLRYLLLDFPIDLNSRDSSGPLFAEALMEHEEALVNPVDTSQIVLIVALLSLR